MIQISKDALIAEIERRKKYYENIQMIKPVYENNIEDFNELLSFIDTLEVKESPIDSFIEEACEWWMDNFEYTDDVDVKYKNIRDFKNYMKGWISVK